MPLTARILARTDLHGPEVLDLMTALAQQPKCEMAVLHTSRQDGLSVVACDPALIVEVGPAGEARWLTPRDLRLPDGEDRVPAEPVLRAWDRMVGTVLLDDSVHRVPLVGWLGFVSYDIGRHIEKIGERAVDDLQWPLMRWALYDGYYIFDHRAGTWTVATMEWSAAREEAAFQRLDRMESILGGIEPDGLESPAPASRLVDALPHAEYLAKVRRVKEYIAAGDIYQANLAQRWTIETNAAPEHLYRRLVAASPAQFAAYFRFADALANRVVVSASPELFIERHGLDVVTRPIKGTRPRDLRDPAQDEALKRELLESPKDAAELAMIVDLLRNDLGRVCEYGSVRVTEARAIEALPTVWHTLASIEGRLRPEAATGWGEIIAAMCPGGSITGAPKIRAMQILDELEPYRRGLYCGNIGWLGPRETGALSIAIRTILLQDAGERGQAYVWAGGGVVADSDPEAEYQETLAKAQALFDALHVPAPGA